MMFNILSIVHRIIDSCEVNCSQQVDFVTKYSGASCEIFLSFVEVRERRDRSLTYGAFGEVQAHLVMEV
jgi:hypothetical protein